MGFTRRPTMPHDSPSSLPLFSLLPMNMRAEEVIDNPQNAHLVSERFEQKPFQAPLRVIDIGLHIGSKSRYTLATIGRDGDIKVEGDKISRIQCSFEIHEGNQQEIILQDRSTNRTTQLFGKTAMPFEEGRPYRRVVVDKVVNYEFGFGGKASDEYQFKILWYEYSARDVLMLASSREDNPCRTRTVIDESPTIAPSQSLAQLRTLQDHEKIRYLFREEIGSGAFGHVFKVADSDSGDYLAVKLVKPPIPGSQDYKCLAREVRILSRLSHTNIIRYRGAQWETRHFAIIMDLKAGNVTSLVQNNVFRNDKSLAKPLLHQMLQALDYLAVKNIIHRDVKPDNILYEPLPNGGYKYYLADFGLAREATEARTNCGTNPYMAPELDLMSTEPQTPKMDVWSLFATIASVLNVDNFQHKKFHTVQLRIDAVEHAAQMEPTNELRHMAIVDPFRRASAADMLDKIFSGEGRVPPHN